MAKLTDTQRRALERMWTSLHAAEPLGAFGRGIGKGTLDSLIELGLATYGQDRFGDTGYLITEAGSAAIDTGRY